MNTRPGLAVLVASRALAAAAQAERCAQLAKHSTAWPLILLAGALASVGAAWRVGDTSVATALAADPALARLIRLMALVKGAAAVAAIAALAWRLQRPASLVLRAAYLGSTWALVAAAVLVWRLSSLIEAGVVLHLAIVVLVVAGWRDRDFLPRARS